MKREIPRAVLEKRRAERHLARASQTYRQFLKAVEDKTHLPSETAEKLTSSVLCLLEQRLTANEAKDFESQLPQQLRELIHRCAEHEEMVGRKFHRIDMMNELSREFSYSHEKIENWVKAIFRVLCDRLSAGEIDDVVSQLPKDMRGLWPATVIERLETQWQHEGAAVPPH